LEREIIRGEGIGRRAEPLISPIHLVEAATNADNNGCNRHEAIVMTTKQIRTVTKKRRPRSTASLNGVAGITTKPPSKLRGILPTPPEVAALMDEWLKDRPATPAARQRIVDDLKLQYYFGGHMVAGRLTEHGVEVLAVGSNAVARLFRKRMTTAEREALLTWHPDPW
jgi:hypothetical protein